MPRLAIRHTCPGDKQWYVCTIGTYQGCCSVDPCAIGSCPDDGGKSTSSESRAHATTTMSTQTQTSLSTTVPLTQLSTSITVSSTLASRSTAVLPSGPVTTSPAAGPVKSASNHNGVLIGAVVGSVVVVILLLGLGFFWLRRSRRKNNGQVNMAIPLVLLGGPKRSREKSKTSAVATDSRAVDGGRGIPERTSDRPTTASQGPSRSAPRPSPARESSSRPSPPKTARKPPRPSPTKPSPTKASPTQQSPIRPSPTKRSPAASMKAPARSIASTSSVTATISSLSSSEAALLSTPASISSAFSLKHLPPIPRPPGRAAIRTELPDTGFYRQRAELAAQSSRELINTFDPRRQLCKSSEIGDFERTEAGCPRPGPVITGDGVVLTANFEQSPGGDELLGISCDSSSSGHVMSFMQYDPEWDAVLPAYQPAWRSQTDGYAGHGVEKSELDRIDES